MKLKTYSAVIIGALLSTSASAKQFWSDTSFSLLQGSNYEVGDSDRTVFTLEHASGHSWGSTFSFVDRLHHNNDDNHEVYGEVGININAFTQKDSFFKEFYVASQWEFNSDAFAQFDNFLLGGGMNIAVPGSKYFNVNLYRRFNDLYDDNIQLTVAFAFPFDNGIVYDGFIDAQDSTDTTEAGVNFTSQLKYDVGQHLGMDKSKLYAGVEYVYWYNKFGIDGITENNANLLIKWHL